MKEKPTSSFSFQTGYKIELFFVRWDNQSKAAGLIPEDWGHGQVIKSKFCCHSFFLAYKQTQTTLINHEGLAVRRVAACGNLQLWKIYLNVWVHSSLSEERHRAAAGSGFMSGKYWNYSFLNYGCFKNSTRTSILPSHLLGSHRFILLCTSKRSVIIFGQIYLLVFCLLNTFLEKSQNEENHTGIKQIHLNLLGDFVFLF